jgi:hypothetical protein
MGQREGEIVFFGSGNLQLKKTIVIFQSSYPKLENQKRLYHNLTFYLTLNIAGTPLILKEI